MPRKIDRRWGDDGDPGEVSFKLTSDQRRELLEMLGPLPWSAEANAVVRRLEAIGYDFRRYHHCGPAAFTRAQARAALEDLLSFDVIDLGAFWALNERAQHFLYETLLDLYQGFDDRGMVVDEALFDNALSDAVLRNAVGHAVERIKSTKGPDKCGEIPWAVWQLCDLYGEVTGKPVTHSNKGKLLAYQSEPRSEAGRFVQRCFKVIDDKVRDTQISSAMRAYVRKRHRKAH